MAQPTGEVSRTARDPAEKLQLMQQAHAQQRSVNLPRVQTRASSAPDPLLERDMSSESSLVESSSEDQGVNSGGKADKAPAYASATQVPVPAIDPATKSEIPEILDWKTALILIRMRRLPSHFSVPNPATKYVLQFADTLVCMAKAPQGELAYLLRVIVSDNTKFNEALTYASVEHLLSLDADPVLNKYKDGQSDIHLSMSLNHLVRSNAVPVLCLLFQHGISPDGSFDMVDGNGDMNIDIVRELLKAGADPWRSLGQPRQLPRSGKHVSIADFYQQTGMDINFDRTEHYPSFYNNSTLGLAYEMDRFEVVEQLLEAGAYVGDVIRLSFERVEVDHRAANRLKTTEAIAAYRVRRAHCPCGFAPYTLLQSTLHPGPAVATNTSISATTTTTTVPVSASGPALAQAALKPACDALIDGLYAAPKVAKFLGCLNSMPPVFVQAVVQALALGRVLGHYGAGQGVRASQLDHEIRVALDAARLWQSYLDSKAQVETLQANIDRHQADGRTLLTMAAAAGNIPMIRLLARLGARVNYPDAHGDYPLTVAARARKPDTCSALLSLGANAGTSDLQKRSTLFHVADWLTQTDISDTATVGRIVSLIEQLLRLGYDLRQPTPRAHADHATHPTVADLLCTPENCVKLALQGAQRTGMLVRAILFNISQRGSQAFLN